MGRAISSMLAQLKGAERAKLIAGAGRKYLDMGSKGWPRDHGGGVCWARLLLCCPAALQAAGRLGPAMTPVTDFEWSYAADT